jgi:4-hydroxy-tetrahydrodipicolinate reductase
MKRIGIIGLAGRMGQLIYSQLESHPLYTVSGGFDLQPPEKGTVLSSLDDVFQKSDCVVDFSSFELTPSVIAAGALCPKPLILGTTGVAGAAKLVTPLSCSVPVLMAPNTSLGAYIQKRIALRLAAILSDDYDIDISEHHHRHKIDAPSGTAVQLADALVQAKNEKMSSTENDGLYHWSRADSPRTPRRIAVTSFRHGAVPGIHEVSFASDYESITISHTCFDRGFLAKSLLFMLDWMFSRDHVPNVYTVDDVFKNHLAQL